MADVGRVAILAPGFAPDAGGAEEHVTRLAGGLAELGVDVEVLALTHGVAQGPERLEGGGMVRRFSRTRPAGLYGTSVPLGRWLSRHRSRYRVLHAYSYHTPLPLLAATATLGTSTPLVVTPLFHGDGHSSAARALHRVYRPFGRWALRRAGRVICISDAERRALEAAVPGLRTMVVPCGTEPTAPGAPRAFDGPIRWIAVGRAEPYKRLDAVVAALAAAPAAHCLDVVTSGPDADRLQVLAERVAPGRIAFRSGVAREELAALYGRAHVALSLSSREAFGMVLLEAASAGCAVVASDLPAHREVAARIDPRRVRLVSLNAGPVEVAAAVAAVVADLIVPAAPPRLTSWAEVASATLDVYRETRA